MWGTTFENADVPFYLHLGCGEFENRWDNTMPTIGLESVRDLKNALRYCGLNELADNFKVV